ncbi:14713_t:CDS:2, partial [Acaulospora colombiana]
MIFKSKLPDIEIPSVGVYQYATSNPNNVSESKVIFIDGITDKKITFGEFKSETKSFAAGLCDKVGFKRGDVLAIISPNQFDYPIVLFGAIAAGGIVTPVNPTYNVTEVSFQLSNSGASVIVSHPLVLPVVVKAATEAQIPHSKIFIFGDEEINGFQPYRALFVDREFEPVTYTPEESKNTIVFLCYSSGTTGKSKGVETTHTNMVANVSQVVSFEKEFTQNSVLMGILVCCPSNIIFPIEKDSYLNEGVSLVVIPKFDLPTFCRVVQDYKVDYAHLVPPILLLLVKSPVVKKYDLSSLRTIVSGAAPLSKSLMNDLNKIYKVTIREGYGLTETSPIVSFTRSNNIVKGKNSFGRWTRQSILPYDVYTNYFRCNNVFLDLELGYNEPGELCIRGPNVMKGYLNNKDATDIAFDKDGFFRTGDVATMDEQENLYIVDRVKELIKYKGFQVPPAELEEILVSYPAVSDAAVIGAYCEADATEYALAYVVLQTDYEQSPELINKIKGYVSDRVAPHKRLKDVIFIDRIPKSVSGKILRRELREKARV